MADTKESAKGIALNPSSREGIVVKYADEHTEGDYDPQSGMRVQKEGFGHDADLNLEQHPPVEVRWENINYSVEVGKGKGDDGGKWKKILKGVSGIVKPGEMLAIMGTSGAGKTTLLDVLAGRIVGGKLEGEVLLNGQRFDRSLFKKLSGYVMQTDRMFPHITVRETLRYAAYMKLPKTVSNDLVERRVEFLLTLLGLQKCATSKVGNEIIKGISGGEKRRLTIAIELIRFPSVIFLDEPTTGLDSFMAQAVMRSLTELTRHGYTVICTIHQPRHTIYAMFGKLMLLTMGQCAFFGPASQAVGHFSSFGYQCPKFTNPADYFLDILTKDTRSQDRAIESDVRIETLLKAWEKKSQVLPANGLTDTSSDKGEVEKADPKRQFRALLDRSWQNNVVRQKGSLIARLVVNALFALILGTLYFKLPVTPQGINDRLGLFFFVLSFDCIFGFFSVDGSFIAERAIFSRERETGTYPVGAYYISRILSELPASLLCPFVFAIILYPMVGLAPGLDRFLYFLLITEMASLAAEAFGIAFTMALPVEVVKIAIRAVMLILIVMLGGYLASSGNLPSFISWCKYLSFIFYSTDALVRNEFSGRELCNDATCYAGDAILVNIKAATYPFWVNLVVLAGMIVAMRVLAYLGLKHANQKVE